MLLGLIGYPLGHSFSKKYFEKKIAELGLETSYSYYLYAIRTIEDFSTLRDVYPEIRGVNITIPYKSQILSYVDSMSEEVNSIGAANVLDIRQGKIKAYNTDIIGFERSFSSLLKSQKGKALIFGTGGAAKAVAYVLKKMDIEYGYVSRNPLVIQDLASPPISYEQAEVLMSQDYNILINATPIGTFPNIKNCLPINYDLITSNFLCLDLVYNPSPSLFLQKSAEQGAKTKDGLEMLYLQADAAWDIWHS